MSDRHLTSGACLFIYQGRRGDISISDSDKDRLTKPFLGSVKRSFFCKKAICYFLLYNIALRGRDYLGSFFGSFFIKEKAIEMRLYFLRIYVISLLTFL